MSATVKTMPEVRFCEAHNLYYLGDENVHKECAKTWELQPREVIYYLNKLRAIEELFGKLRVELAI